MTVAAPLAGECAAHRGVKADWTCQRCGSFVCTQCERRTRPDAPPLCPQCWVLREQAVQVQQAKDSSRMQSVGLGLGIFSIHPLVIIPSLIVNIRELMRGTGGTRLWMNKVGLGLTLLFTLAYLGLFLVGISQGLRRS